MADIATRSPTEVGYERQLLDLLRTGCVGEITLHMLPHVNVAVDLRHRLHELAKKMRDASAPSAIAERATLSVVFTTADGVERKYRDNSSLPPDGKVETCKIVVALDFTAENQAADRLLA
jgi:hypothetical protein